MQVDIDIDMDTDMHACPQDRNMILFINSLMASYVCTVHVRLGLQTVSLTMQC